MGVGLNNPSCLDLYRLPWYYGDGSNVDPNPDIRKVTVNLFEVFQLEGISMVANVEDTATTYLVASPINPEQKETREQSIVEFPPRHFSMSRAYSHALHLLLILLSFSSLVLFSENISTCAYQTALLKMGILT
jgi:hypothetical protein